MGLQNFIRLLLPREDHFYDYLEQQAVVAHEGAKALAGFDHRSGPEVREAVQKLEHEGDKIVHAMEEALAKTFVTPIDREDLQKLSSELDDVLDLMNGAARACVLFALDKPTAPMIELAKCLVQSTEILRDAMPNLKKHAFSELIEATRKVRKIEKEADGIFRDAISKLFHDPSIDAKVLLREKEILEDLEFAVDRCEHVSGTLTNLAVKHG